MTDELTFDGKVALQIAVNKGMGEQAAAVCAVHLQERIDELDGENAEQAKELAALREDLDYYCRQYGADKETIAALRERVRELEGALQAADKVLSGPLQGYSSIEMRAYRDAKATAKGGK